SAARQVTPDASTLTSKLVIPSTRTIISATMSHSHQRLESNAAMTSTITPAVSTARPRWFIEARPNQLARVVGVSTSGSTAVGSARGSGLGNESATIAPTATA